MPINSIQLEVKALLNGLPIPDQNVPLTAYVAPPITGDAANVTAFIWGAKLREKRFTYGISHKLNYDISIWVYQVMEPGLPDQDIRFPLVLDAIMQQLRTSIMPTDLTDPITGQVSQLLSIGETMELQYGPVIATDDQQWYIYQACIIASVEETLMYVRNSSQAP